MSRTTLRAEPLSSLFRYKAYVPQEKALLAGWSRTLKVMGNHVKFMHFVLHFYHVKKQKHVPFFLFNVQFQKIFIPPPQMGFFPNTSPPLWKFQLSSRHFVKLFGPKEPPSSQEIPIPSVGRVGIFSGTAQHRIKQLSHSLFVISRITKVSVRVFSRSCRKGFHPHSALAHNPYLDLDYSGCHKTLIQ